MVIDLGHSSAEHHHAGYIFSEIQRIVWAMRAGDYQTIENGII
jgi:hypothetical protein